MGTPARAPAQRDGRRVARLRRGHAPPPRRREGAGRARDRRPVAHADRRLDLRRHAHPRAVRGPPDRLVRRLAARRPRGQPVRAPRRGAQARRRHEHDGAARDRRHRRPRAPGGHGRVRAPARPGPRGADHPASAAGRAARGRVVHPRRPRAVLGELAAAAGLHLPRGAGAAHGRLARRGRAAPGRAPAVVRRDGGALPRPDAGPPQPHGLRRRRVGPGLHDHLAAARLRLPGRDHLPRRRAARLRGRAAGDPERDLPARGGRRGRLEARRRGHRCRGAPAPADGGLQPRHGGELRVPRLLAALRGRHDRVRGARHRDHGHHAVPRRGAAVRHGRRHGHLRADPPALHRRPAGPRRRR